MPVWSCNSLCALYICAILLQSVSMPTDDTSGGVVELIYLLDRPPMDHNYTCTASNSVGNVSETISVVVRGLCVCVWTRNGTL